MSIADKAIETVTKNVSLEIKLKDAEAKIFALQQEHVQDQPVLRSEIDNLKVCLNQERNKSASLDQQLRIIHSINLNEKHQSVLVAVASKSGSDTACIAEYAGLPECEALEKLSYMESQHLVHRGHRHRTVPDPDKPRGIQQQFFTWTVLSRGHHCIIALGLQEKIT